MKASPHIVVIDPAVKTPEVECFNALALMSPLPLTYHLPAMYGMQSLRAEAMGAVKGMLILGSAASVHDRHSWQKDLEAWLRPHLTPSRPTLGLCYGHQMLAYMFGGDVGYVSPDRQKHKGLRRVQLVDLPWCAQGSYDLVVSHCETVTRPPAEMEVIASSAEIATDGLCHKSLPLWSLQPHPEATAEFLHNHAISVKEAPQALTPGQNLMHAFLKYVAKTAP